MSSDPIRPSYYNQHPCGFAAVELLEHLPFNLGTALKYLFRADHKHATPTDDLRKTRWYLVRELERQRHVTDRRACSEVEEAWPYAERVLAADQTSLLAIVLKAVFDPNEEPAKPTHALRLEAALKAYDRALVNERSAETLPAPAEDVCEKCSRGKLRMLSGPGRMFPTANEEGAFEIPAHLAILTCDHCGTQLLNAATIDALADAETKHRFPNDHDPDHVSTCGICKGAGWKNLSLTLAEIEYASQWKNRWPEDRPWGQLSRAERAHFRIASENERERQARIDSVRTEAKIAANEKMADIENKK